MSNHESPIREFARYQCWRDGRIAEVINTEAVSVALPEFLATHTPLSHIRYESAPRKLTETSEGGFLAELQGRTARDEHTFAVVRGAPGTGKSHLIRWLTQQYEATTGGSDGPDIVVLIERAQCSLRNTLRQITDRVVAAGLLDEESTRAMMRKLEYANGVLADTEMNVGIGKGADDTLDARILNAFQAAAVAFRSAHRERATAPVIKPMIVACTPEFLLDTVVRDHLVQGSVARIRRFLRDGTRKIGGLGTDEQVHFTADDLKLSVTQRMRLPRGSQARILADNIERIPELREELARYLNLLFNDAIGELTLLKAGDVRELFDDLRRQLRTRGKGLALFVEDITAFTGIDAAFVDVLITQHTGESNRAFCRLTSVVGITDSYYNVQFPDNLKQRITHLLALDTPSTGRAEAAALRTEEAVASMAARYLNAVRLGREDLDSWVQMGATPESLPNACVPCPFRAPCHAAFGAIDVAPAGEAANSMGLYPYNAHALHLLYRGATTPGFEERTPRVLLNLVLGNVLRRYGDRVQRGEFPPPARELGDSFALPALVPGGFEQLRARVPAAELDRIDALLRVWGDCSTLTTEERGDVRVGGLPASAFDAFGLTLPSGVAPSAPRTIAPAFSPPGPRVDSPPDGPGVVAPLPAVDANAALRAELALWRDGGSLRSHAKILERASDLLEDGIDWEAWSIRTSQAKERLGVGKLRIEGQTARTNTPNPFVFARSTDNAVFFEALLDLDVGVGADPATIARVLPTVRQFLSTYEDSIVAHVRGPESPPVQVTLVVVCLLLECLMGNPPRGETRVDRLVAFLRSVAKPSVEGDPHAKASAVHGEEWTRLLRRFRKEQIKSLRGDLLEALNCAQGGVRAVRFLDAAVAFDAFQSFTATKGVLAPMAGETSLSPSVYAAYRAFEEFLPAVLEAEQVYQSETRGTIRALIGDASPGEIFAEIERVLQALQDQRLGYAPFEARPELRPTTLDRVLALEVPPSEEGPLALLIKLATLSTPAASDFLAYLAGFARMLEKQEAEQAASVAREETKSAGAVQLQSVIQLFADALDALDATSRALARDLEMADAAHR